MINFNENKTEENRPRCRHRHIYTKCNVSQLDNVYMITNTKETFEAQFFKKLSNIKTELKKCVAYIKKACIAEVIFFLCLLLYKDPQILWKQSLFLLFRFCKL